MDITEIWDAVPFELLLIAVSFVMAVPALIAFGVYRSVVALGRPDLCLVAVDAKKYSDQFRYAAEHQPWAKEQGFTWIGAYRLGAAGGSTAELKRAGLPTMFIAAWEHSEEPSYFLIYCHGSNSYYDFVTLFSEGASVTSGSTKDALTIPSHADAFVQAFSGLACDELWEKHREAEVYVMQARGCRKQPLTASLDEYMLSAIGRQMEHVRSLPLWPLRGIYWFVVRRNTLINRSIEEQHRSGTIAL